MHFIPHILLLILLFEGRWEGGESHSGFMILKMHLSSHIAYEIVLFILTRDFMCSKPATGSGSDFLLH